MNELNLNVSPVYLANAKALEQGYRIIANQGGTRSGKTYSLMQLILTLCHKLKNTSITVTSISLPHLKKGALRDFDSILATHNLYNEENINFTDLIYYFSSNYVEFFSSDNHLKVHGPSRDILFINEANLIDYKIFKQLLLRTRKTIIIDYNPSDEFHWIYDHVLTRSDCKFIQSTYLENYDYLPIEQIEEIERLKEEDQNYWNIYGLGERGTSVDTIYTHWKLCDSLPGRGEIYYGLDFGFKNATALVKIEEYEQDCYAKEMLYQAGLTNGDLLNMLPELVKNKSDYIYADHAEPQRIEELQREGWNVHPADKSVKDGIDSVKRKKLYICKDSVNMQKEIKSYKYKSAKDGKVFEEPVKFNDHLMDALRYGVHTKSKTVAFDFR